MNDYGLFGFLFSIIQSIYLPTNRDWLGPEEDNGKPHRQYSVHRQLMPSGRLSACTLALAKGRVLLGVEMMEQPGR